MTIANRERVLVALVREIAAETHLSLTTFSQDWILRLERGDFARHIFGYNFEINSASARLIAADKAGTADLLAHQKIPHVEHRLFLHPGLAGYVSGEGNWDAMQSYTKTKGFPLVVKPNEGTGGEDIFKVDNALELEQAVGELFERQRAICFSPFLEIEEEYRVIVLDEDCPLIYAKQRPRVRGDGHSSILELVENMHLNGALSQKQATAILDNHRGDLRQVLDKGQELLVGWKHNLAEGASPHILDDEEKTGKLCALAQAAREAIHIRFASVDIVEVGRRLSVLEINSGVMMEYFARHHPQERERIKRIYALAIEKMFAIK